MGSPHPAQGDSRIASTMRIVVGTPVGTPRPVGLPMAGDKPRRYGVALPQTPVFRPGIPVRGMLWSASLVGRPASRVSVGIKLVESRLTLFRAAVVRGFSPARE